MTQNILYKSYNKPREGLAGQESRGQPRLSTGRSGRGCARDHRTWALPFPPGQGSRHLEVAPVAGLEKRKKDSKGPGWPGQAARPAASCSSSLHLLPQAEGMEP